MIENILTTCTISSAAPLTVATRLPAAPTSTAVAYCRHAARYCTARRSASVTRTRLEALSAVSRTLNQGALQAVRIHLKHTCDSRSGVVRPFVFWARPSATLLQCSSRVFSFLNLFQSSSVRRHVHVRWRWHHTDARVLFEHQKTTRLVLKSARSTYKEPLEACHKPCVQPSSVLCSSQDDRTSRMTDRQGKGARRSTDA